MKLGRYLRKLKNSYRSNKKTFAFYIILRIMVVLTLIRSLVAHNYESAATCILVLLLFLLPALIEDLMDLTIPPLFQGILFGFIFAAEILGEVDHYYVKIPGWDTILHTLNGFLFAAVGFSLIYLLNRGSKSFNLSPFYLTLVAFCFSMTIGVIWEFFECGMDLFFDMDMQKDFVVQNINSVTLDPKNGGKVIHVDDITSTLIRTSSGKTYTIQGGYLDIGILDTMKDLLVNLIGAVVFSIIGYTTLKTSKTSKVADSLMIRPNEHAVQE
ncbi:hypothetical protein [Eubacterium sp. AB3007]|uniref:hypothetical protein n=1 Tax=Eubacterium sp. AB3007 TaxID=1392487 RepID=UPI000552EC9D|nr:hypothetical protein [Eubacterium sp. AB3007]